MCGFVALVGRAGEAPQMPTLARMLSVIAHRGPDDSGTYQSENVALGFRRLAILDLTTAGHQPMSSADGSVTVVFNGEIYNYLELQKDLESRGHRFRSRTDTEVLLHSYLEWGDACVERFNGMWAFLIHDRNRGRVFGSRDRFGMKPLYICELPHAVILASEIKSILASGYYTKTPDLGVVAKYLHFGVLDDTDATFYKGIQSVPAGHNVEIYSSGKARTSRYWDLPESTDPSSDPTEEFADLFEQAVRLHMRSDVPVGVNLSGGLDSTAILCSIARLRDGSGNSQLLKTFSFEAAEYDESKYIAATIAQTGAQRFAISSGPHELWNSLATVLWYQDEPVHSLTAVVGFHLSALAAANGVKVVVNGQGADEVLGGYGSYFRDYWYSLATAGNVIRTLCEIGAFSNQHGGSTVALAASLAKHVVQTGLRRSSTYRRLARNRLLKGLAKDDWFDPELAKAMPSREDVAGEDLNSILHRSVTDYPLPLYLRVEDRNAMAHSVEARLPFLDPRLVDLAFRLPPDWKMRGPWNKFLLREAMRGRIPEIVRNRPDKMGFPTPFSRWLANELYESARAALDDKSFSALGLFRVEAIRRDLEKHKRGEIDIGQKFLRAVQVGIWYQLNPTGPASIPSSASCVR